MEGLGDLPWWAVASSLARGVSSDGEVVVGVGRLRRRSRTFIEPSGKAARLVGLGFLAEPRAECARRVSKPWRYGVSAERIRDQWVR